MDYSLIGVDSVADTTVSPVLVCWVRPLSCCTVFRSNQVHLQQQHQSGQLLQGAESKFTYQGQKVWL